MDYWDRLGWKDPFADPAFTARQRAYIPKLGTRGLVTPQVLIGNARAAKGWEKKLREAAAKPARLIVSAKLSVADGKVEAKIGLREPAADPEAEVRAELPATAVVRAVLYQKQAVTKVTSGENAGKTLTEYFVVRRVAEPIAVVTALDEAQKVTLELPKGVEKENLGLAVVVEDTKAMITIEASVFDLP